MITWNMISEVEKSLGIKHTAIIRCCKNTKKLLEVINENM